MTSCSESNTTPDDEIEIDSILLVFVSGTEGYACYRTPSMVVTQQGTVLAFCERRVNNCDDEGDIDIVMKRSTDGGKTWSPIMVLENNGLNPCKNPCPVELSNGDIMLNSRNGMDGQHWRAVNISTDGGETSEKSYLETELFDAGACQGSILFHSLNDSTGKANIIFSNPDDEVDRVNGSLKLSVDDGENWIKKVRYSNPYPAFSGYSDIALINDGDIAVLFETGPHYIKQLRYEGLGFKILKFTAINEPM